MFNHEVIKTERKHKNDYFHMETTEPIVSVLKDWVLKTSRDYMQDHTHAYDSLQIKTKSALIQFKPFLQEMTEHTDHIWTTKGAIFHTTKVFGNVDYLYIPFYRRKLWAYKNVDM